MPKRLVMSKMSVFILIWFGQLVSLIGSSLTSFALGVWVYQRTGSVTQFSLIYLFALLPGILISPVAGALVDRWNRRWCMILSDCCGGVCTAAIAFLLATRHLEIWHIYLAACLYSVFKAFQLPAYTAATTLLVPKENLPRANGMVQSGEAISTLLSPLLAGILLGIIQLPGVIFVDFATFLFAFTTLLIVRFPDVKTTRDSEDSKSSIWHETIYGFSYITNRPGILVLLILFTTNNFVFGLIEALFTPLVLSFTSVTVLGIIQSIGGLGMFIGSLVISTWGGPKSLIFGVCCFIFLSQISILALGLRTSAELFALGNFFYFFSSPIINTCFFAILQKKVTPDVQGRVFAVARMICWSSLPLAYLAAGPLADKIFEPLMAANGLLAGSIGQIIGVGSGRGIGLLFVVMGILAMLVIIAAYQYPRFRLVEKELPDAI